MLEKLVSSDSILNHGLFLDDEVQYNLIHRICESENATCLKSAEGDDVIFAQSKGQNPWLWMAKTMGEERKARLIQTLLDHLTDKALPGITAAPDTAMLFAEAYARRHTVSHHTYMSTAAYSCPQLRKPIDVKGSIQRAAREHLDSIAAFLAGFSEDAYGSPVSAESQITAADALVNSGYLYLWMVEGKPVSMANIAHRSPRHARINAVYTPPSSRQRGYASALVAELCSIVAKEGLTPLLYADLKNPQSNKIYQSIGFIEQGVIANIRFGF